MSLYQFSTIFRNCMKIVWQAFSHTLDLWNCMISIFGVCRQPGYSKNTSKNRRAQAKHQIRRTQSKHNQSQSKQSNIILFCPKCSLFLLCSLFLTVPTNSFKDLTLIQNHTHLKLGAYSACTNWPRYVSVRWGEKKTQAVDWNLDMLIVVANLAHSKKVRFKIWFKQNCLDLFLDVLFIVFLFTGKR